MSAYEVLVAGAALATGLAGGVVYAFSAFVMAGLRRLAPDDGAAAMRAINRDAVRPPLMVLLLAAVALPVAGAVVGLVTSAQGAAWAVVGAVVAVVGILGVTGFGNVPLNDRLEAADDPGAEWQRFVRPWLRWNHVRATSWAVAALFFVVAA